MKKSNLSSILLFFVTLFIISSANAAGYWKVVWDANVTYGNMDISEYAYIGDNGNEIFYDTAGPGDFEGNGLSIIIRGE